MKLFLSSLNLSQLPNKLIPEYKKLLTVERSGDSKPHVLVINNAADYKGAQEIRRREEADKVLDSYGIDHRLVDLKTYKNNPGELKRLFEQADGIFLGGGNTFYLRYLLKITKADEFMKQEANKGLVVGEGSAGAFVMAPSLKYIDLADDPKEAPEVILEGLNLVDFEPLAHADSEKYGHIIQQIKQSFEKDHIRCVEINDNQAIIVDEGKVTLV